MKKLMVSIATAAMIFGSAGVASANPFAGASGSGCVGVCSNDFAGKKVDNTCYRIANVGGRCYGFRIGGHR